MSLEREQTASHPRSTTRRGVTAMITAAIAAPISWFGFNFGHPTGAPVSADPSPIVQAGSQTNEIVIPYGTGKTMMTTLARKLYATAHGKGDCQIIAVLPADIPLSAHRQRNTFDILTAGNCIPLHDNEVTLTELHEGVVTLITVQPDGPKMVVVINSTQDRHAEMDAVAAVFGNPPDFQSIDFSAPNDLMSTHVGTIAEYP